MRVDIGYYKIIANSRILISYHLYDIGGRRSSKILKKIPIFSISSSK